MQISLNWLKQHVEGLDKVDPQELGLKLTMATVEVESVENQAELLIKVVVGKIVKLEKHPDADRLQVAQVDIGNKKVKVVCGGSNLKQNMLVAMALSGAKVRWHGEGELVELKSTKVRGVESDGMICAGVEIGLDSLFPAKAKNEIVDLSVLKLQVGQPLADALGLNDVIFEIDNKSLTNRPDLWGHYGIAREVAAIVGSKLKPYKLDKFKKNKQIDLKVKIDDFAACPRYMAIALEGVKISESPDWLKKQLEAIGQKSINNIVDITNYVMYDLGQPLHAFSADKIVDNKIIVRKAIAREKITTLDGEARKLIEDDLLITDNEKPIALAGVMGNQNSEINTNTNVVIIESATFEPFTVRKTADRLDLRSEAAIRFEKNLDPNLAEIAINKAVNLIQEVIPEAKVVSNLIDESKFKLDQGPISLSWEFIDKRIGEKLEQKKIISILQSLGFDIKANKHGLEVKVPTWRATKDVSIKEDIIEEITRIFGYDNITPQMPAVAIDYLEENKLRVFERRLKDVLALSLGANEVYNYSFVEQKFLEKLNQPITHVELVNPWAEGVNLMRQSLIPNLLKSAAGNLRFFEQINLFEVGKVFIKDQAGAKVKPDSKNKLPAQPLMAAGIIVDQDPFFTAKGIIETLAQQFSFKFSFVESTPVNAWCHPKQHLNIVLNKKVVGCLCTVHPKVAEVLDVKVKMAVWQLDLGEVVDSYPVVNKYQELPKYPAVNLDLSVVIDDQVKWKDIKSLVLASDNTIISAVDLLDVFKNDKIEVGKKSLTFRTTYQSDERTLEMDEVNKLHEKIIAQLKKAVGAEVRG